ncbi:Cyclic nucleotide-binding domain protein [Legionella birminghamensis]|uniref:Cyclic nucleotide-binding domain n=1 Tax=Legionella birminghamensis TaxID=28083 RepID=A0A378I9K0_9GAMM|nr:hypothetical protein [Legionella birminghamensis]KTC68904.1 Cyclic nucleotide-binding domain protein [Legionella birminghamensis]STX31420.1 Cyclic nucleotide-binding domain [Legionella birminghamensis]
MDLSYHIAELLVLFSYLFRNMLYLRIVACCASLLYMHYSLRHNLPDIFWWSAIYLIVNFIQIFLIVKEKFPIELNPTLQAIKEKFFKHVSTSDFMKIIKLSGKGQAGSAHLMIKDKPVSQLLLITGGSVLVQFQNQIIELGPYHFLGEMSFFNNQLATADVTVKEQADFIYWDYEAIRRLQERQPNLFIYLLEAIGKDIMLKMTSNPKQPIEIK